MTTKIMVKYCTFSHLPVDDAGVSFGNGKIQGYAR